MKWPNERYHVNQLDQVFDMHTTFAYRAVKEFTNLSDPNTEFTINRVLKEYVWGLNDPPSKLYIPITMEKIFSTDKEPWSYLRDTWSAQFESVVVKVHRSPDEIVGQQGEFIGVAKAQPSLGGAENYIQVKEYGITRPLALITTLLGIANIVSFNARTMQYQAARKSAES